MSTTKASANHNRKHIALGGIVGATAVVASLFALSIGAGAQDGPATAEVAPVGQVEADVIDVSDFAVVEYELGTETGNGVAAEMAEVDSDAEVIDIADADLTEYELGSN